MKTTLIFNLDKPEEREEYETCMAAQAMRRVLWEFDQGYLRKKIKYEELTGKEQEIYEKIRLHLWDLLRQEGIENLL